jgi:lipoprotein signal peptidase
VGRGEPAGREHFPLLGDALGIKLIYNPGAAFSIGSGTTWVFTIAAGGAVVAASWFTWRVRLRAWAVCLGLLLGGAVTHFLDRLLRAPSFGQGHVVDFIAYFDWFVGNVADIALFAAGVLVVALSAVETTPPRAAHRPPMAKPSTRSASATDSPDSVRWSTVGRPRMVRASRSCPTSSARAAAYQALSGNNRSSSAVGLDAQEAGGWSSSRRTRSSNDMPRS